MHVAADMGFSPPFTVLEGGFSRDNVVTVGANSLENTNNLKQMSHSKPPRHLSVVRHCVSSARLSSDLDTCCQKIPSHGKSEFSPVFRSGSCSERRPKQYMEDEHICIDNLEEHLVATLDVPSPGAFYGVCE